jgi:hypothetical protein
MTSTGPRVASLSLEQLYAFNTFYMALDPVEVVGGVAEDLSLVREEIVAREMRVFETEVSS